MAHVKKCDLLRLKLLRALVRLCFEVVNFLAKRCQLCVNLLRSGRFRALKFTPAERKQGQKALENAQAWLKSTKSPAPEEVDTKLAALGKEIDDLEAKSNEGSEEL
jgi:hypothetical protein